VTDTLQEIAATVRLIHATMEIPISISIHFDKGAARIGINIASEQNITHEFSDPVVLLAWLKAISVDSNALHEGIQYKNKEMLIKRQAEDKAALEAIEQATATDSAQAKT